MPTATTMTSNKDTAPGLLVDAAEGLADAVDAGPGGPSSDREWRGPAALRHEHFRTAGRDAVRRFFASAYRPGWQLAGLSKGLAVTHRRCESPLVTLDDVQIQGEVSCEISPADSVVVIQPQAGTLTVAGEASLIADGPVLVDHGTSCVLRVSSARFAVVSIGVDVLRRAAALGHAPLPQQIRFLDWHPRSQAAVRAWHRALDYVTATFASTDTVQQPLIVAAAAPLLATALLECYPSNVSAEQDLLNDPAFPQALKDAVSFIHRHANSDVGVNDVAAAVHLTPRAIQYIFRQQLDTTPTEYLRRVRLHRAHQDLTAGDHFSTTVTAIARRWGFAHTGRFAVLYRETYGRSPHTTLG